MTTIRVVLSPESENTPSALWYHLLKTDGLSEVKVREKPYGLLIKGSKEAVDRVASALRKLDPYGVFIMESAPPVKGHKIFRGFLQSSGEIKTLPLISQALRDFYDKNGSEPKSTGRQVRCRFLESFSADCDAVAIDHGDGDVEVRCPSQIFYGYNICGLQACFYGKPTSERMRELIRAGYGFANPSDKGFANVFWH